MGRSRGMVIIVESILWLSEVEMGDWHDMLRHYYFFTVVVIGDN